MNLLPFSGYVVSIRDAEMADEGEVGCFKIFTLKDGAGSIVHFVISPTTYFVEQALIREGDWMTGYYDGNAPAPLIYPPQYEAIVVAKFFSYQNIKVAYFNSDLISEDGQLALHVSPFTPVLLRNGQRFTNRLENRNLVVTYGPATKSIPAQTSPYKIVVLCQ